MKFPEKHRVQGDTGKDGAFIVQFEGRPLHIIASNGLDWDHVSVSFLNRCPNWREMCFVKDLFWDESECVVQYHPPKTKHINFHPYCLHLWKPQLMDIVLPPSIMV